MTYFIRALALLVVCIASTGCIADHTLTMDDDPNGRRRTTPDPAPCNIESPSCGDGLLCALVDSCGSPCPEGAAEDGLACPQVCVEVFACVQPLVIEDVCDPEMSRCGDGLTCALDEGRCGPTDCYDEGCAECPPVFTCQPHEIPVSCDQIQCSPGFICEMTVSEGCGYADPVEQRACEALPPELATCVELEDHLIGDSCDDTHCLQGFDCEENDVYLPCDGPGCERPVDVHVSCVEIVEHIIGETCEETTCAVGFECWEDENAICFGPDCDIDPGVTITCQPEQPPVGIGGHPEGAPDSD